MQTAVTSFRQQWLWQTLTYRAVLAGRWASVPQRWPCRGWSHTHQQCSPRLGSRGQAACGAASPARSAAKNFGPGSTMNRETIRVKGSKSKFEMLWNVYNLAKSLPHQSLLEWQCPVSSDSAFCTSWWRWTPVGNNTHGVTNVFLFEGKSEGRGKKTRK